MTAAPASRDRETVDPQRRPRAPEPCLSLLPSPSPRKPCTDRCPTAARSRGPCVLVRGGFLHSAPPGRSDSARLPSAARVGSSGFSVQCPRGPPAACVLVSWGALERRPGFGCYSGKFQADPCRRLFEDPRPSGFSEDHRGIWGQAWSGRRAGNPLWTRPASASAPRLPHSRGRPVGRTRIGRRVIPLWGLNLHL